MTSIENAIKKLLVAYKVQILRTAQGYPTWPAIVYYQSTPLLHFLLLPTKLFIAQDS